VDTVGSAEVDAGHRQCSALFEEEPGDPLPKFFQSVSSAGRGRMGKNENFLLYVEFVGTEVVIGCSASGRTN